MDLNLNQKNVLVTGSSRGIGRGIAQAFLDEGSNVMVNARTDVDIKKFNLRNSNQLSVVKADVSTVEGVSIIEQQILEKFQNRLDIIICNVGSGKSAPPGTESYVDWKNSFEINFFSSTNTIEGLRRLITPKTGSILCISSICGLEVLGAALTYSAAKAALNSYVIGLSRVMGKDGIRVNAIAPGNILFDGSVWDQKLKADEKAVNNMLEKEVALNTLGSVSDIANMAVFLSSEQAKFVTGSIVVVDGGQVRAW